MCPGKKWIGAIEKYTVVLEDGHKQWKLNDAINKPFLYCGHVSAGVNFVKTIHVRY